MPTERLESRGLQTNMRETDKGYFYANRVDTSRQRSFLSALSKAGSAASGAAGHEAQQEIKTEYNKGRTQGASMEDQALQAAIHNESQSDVYRRGLRSIALNRAYLDIQGNLSKHAESLVDKDYTPEQIRQELTKYGTDLMNNNETLKGYDTNEVASLLYEPVLANVDRQVDVYNQKVTSNMRVKTYSQLGATAEQSLLNVSGDKSLNSEHYNQLVLSDLSALQTQLQANDFDYNEVNSKIMETVTATALKTGDLRIFRAVEGLQVDGKSWAKHPENAYALANLETQLKNQKKAAYAEAKAQQARRQKEANDAFFTSTFLEFSQTGNTDANTWLANAARTHGKDGVLAAAQAIQLAQKTKNTQKNADNTELVNTALANITAGITTFDRDQIIEMSMDNGLTWDQTQSLLTATSPKGISKLRSGNPAVDMTFKRFENVITKGSDGIELNSGKNSFIMQKVGDLTVLAQRLSEHDGGQFSEASLREFNKYADVAFTAIQGYQSEEPEPSEGTEVDKESIQYLLGSEGSSNNQLVDRYLSDPKITPEHLAQAIYKKSPQAFQTQSARDELLRTLYERKHQLATRHTPNQLS